MKEHNNIDDLFKDAFDGFSVLPDDSIKSAIDKHLFEKKSKRRFGFWLFFSGVAFGLIAGTYYFVANNQTEPSSTTNGSQHLASNTINIKKTEETSYKVETETKISKNSTEIETEKKQERAIKKTNIYSTYQPSKKNRSESMNHSTSMNLEGNRSEVSLLNLSKNSNLIGVLKVKNRDLRLDERTDELEFITGSDDSAIVAPMEMKSKNKVQQSIAAFINYGYESTTSRNTAQNYNDFETGTIKISGKEGRIEYKRSISNSIAFNAGLGYGNYSILQKGELTTWHIGNQDGSGIVTSDTLPPIYTPSYYSDEVIYRFQQIQLGIGISYTRSIFQNWNLDVSLGSNFNFGKIRKLSGSSLFETPSVSKVGVSLYFRPAIEYRFGRYAILAFGQANQSIASQIKWSFLSNRNTNFGGGIACRYYF